MATNAKAKKRTSLKDSCLNLATGVYASFIGGEASGGALSGVAYKNDFNRSFPIGIDDHRVTLVRTVGSGGLAPTHGASQVYVKGFGLFVSYVEPKSAADHINLRPGDEILTIDEDPIDTLISTKQDFDEAINKPNRVTLLIRRPRIARLVRTCSGMQWGLSEKNGIITSIGDADSPASRAGLPLRYGIVTVNNQEVLGEDAEGMKTVLSLTNDKVLELGLRCLSVYTSMRASYMKQMAEARKATERRRSIDHEMTLKWSEADHKRLRAAQESCLQSLQLGDRVNRSPLPPATLSPAPPISLNGNGVVAANRSSVVPSETIKVQATAQLKTSASGFGKHESGMNLMIADNGDDKSDTMDETIGDDTPGYVRQNSELMDATEIRQKLSDRKKAEDLLKEEERKAQNSSPVTPYINTTPSRAPVFIGIHHTILAKEVDTDATTDADKDDNGHSPAHTETQTHTDNHTESDASTASGTSVMANPPPFTGIHGMVQNGDVSVSGGTNSTAPEKPDYRMDMLMDIFRKESINGHLNCTGPCCKTKRPS